MIWYSPSKDMFYRYDKGDISCKYRYESDFRVSAFSPYPGEARFTSLMKRLGYCVYNENISLENK